MFMGFMGLMGVMCMMGLALRDSTHVGRLDEERTGG
jgi:hypothetical protein